MVKPRGKKQDSELSLSAIVKQQRLSKNSGKIQKKSSDSSKTSTVKAKRSRNRIKEQIAVISTPEGPVEKEIRTNCKIWSFLRSAEGDKVVLTRQQIQSVKEVGFGGMLEINITKYPPGILAYLVSNFDPNGWVQWIKSDKLERQYYLGPGDVHDILGLPINQRNLIQSSFNNKELVSRWKRFFGVGDDEDLKTHMVLDKFKDYPEGGDVFKQLFVLYVGSTIIAPLPESKIRYNLLPVVEVVSGISSFDWCQYTMSVLSSSIARILKAGSTHSMVNGCSIILLVAYFYRLVFKGQRYPMTLPLIQNLTDQMLKVRFCQEREGGFGNGMLLDGVFPICEVSNLFNVGGVKQLHGGDAGGQDEVDNVLKFTIPDGINKDYQIKSIAKDPVEEASLMLKRDIDVVVHTFMDRLCEASKERVENECPVSVTQEIFQNNEWLSSIDALVEELLKKSNCSQKVVETNVVGHSTPDQHQDEVVNFEGVLTTPETNVVVDITDVPSALKECCSLELGPSGVDVPYVSQFMILNKEVFQNFCVLEKEVIDYCLLEETMDSYEDVFAYGDFYAISRAEICSLKNNVPISGVIIDCWACYLCMIERKQEQMIPNKALKAFVFTTQPSRALEHLLTEKDNEKAISLKVEVIDAWQLHVEFMNAKAEIQFKNMFFIPMTYDQREHYVLFVIDTRSKVVHYLDNIKRRKDYKEAANLSKIIVGCFSDFLEVYKHPCADEVISYNVSIVKMPWTVNEANDCGVYASFFMEQFMGDKNFGPLTSVENRIRYRGSICSRLVLSDVNKNRDELMKNLDSFKTEKEGKRPLIMAERQLRLEYSLKKKEDDARKRKEEYAKKKEEFLQKKKAEEAQKKKEEEASKGLQEMNTKIAEDKPTKRSRNKLVPVRNITLKK